MNGIAYYVYTDNVIKIENTALTHYTANKYVKHINILTQL